MNNNYFCNGPKESEVNLVSQMENCGLFKDILGARNIVAHHAQSLIYNVNNNAVEGFNSVVAKYGIENEPMAKKDFEKKFDFKIEPAGLFIHTKLNYLAASPDGLIGKDAIVEIKCPQSFVVDKILRDNEFWKNNIEPQCTKLYMESLVREL
ncbi:Restriction endonuclease type II-like,YqaJ viral recombinase,Exonuclease, phage-type/RecB, C- [Cinara cedri]|uniref:Restriction endonuclease type II-like,YqaJ viral recombinase,Exonuclease, phage-type/RecB, C n=1 Tax=Cinara cedri TaxID=506608 RepID=A0A5E4N9F0_9HEMI|nr:Restriction endonuclease type II-like,YqaJ viral recombinase,Exonuclease, phage-type/RecB, C- [Cinara cedri]